jgi:D-serine deaminase-like pyridoxal phosphate-dependent protein
MPLNSITKYDLDTPALIIDLDRLNHNINYMAEYIKTVTPNLRPHMKTHKIPIISHMQIEAGAIGITCQKLSEAEVFAQSGIKNILVSNQIANPQKINHFIQLSKWADVIVTVDNLDVSKLISEAAISANIIAKIAVEIAMVRCGVEHGKPALEFIQQLCRLKGIQFMGIWEHEAGCSPTFDLGLEVSWMKRKEAHFAGLNDVLETKHMIEKSGIPVDIFSAGHTATFDITSTFPEVTDIQAGSYVFMDWPYRQLEHLEQFQEALTVLTTVISIPRHQKVMAYTDCGTKSISYEHTSNYKKYVFPKVKGELGDHIDVVNLSEEHGHLQGDLYRLKVGDKLEFIPSHCCTTTSRYDKAYVVSGDDVVAEWPILARGSHT